MSVNVHLRHRGGIETQVRRLYPDLSLFRRIGGRSVVAQLVDHFYDRIAGDPQLCPKFAGDLSQERENQKRFFEEWLGGDALYSQHVANRGLRQIHDHIHISNQDAKRWLGHFTKALQEAGIAAPLRREVLATLRPLAHALVNEEKEAGPNEHRCRRSMRWAKVAKAAETGDVATVRRAVSKEPRLLHGWASDMQTLLFRAAGRGQKEVVNWLLDAGADPNAPSHVWWGSGLESPLLIARRRRRTDIVERLKKHGAVEDIFLHAALGNWEGVNAWLEKDARLLNAADPAHDTFHASPLFHAVVAGQREVAEQLLARGAEVGPLSTLLVRSAADHEDVALVQLLLAHGADATRVGAGRWVLNAELSRLLVSHGADVNYAANRFASWIWKVCTGNHAQKDDPEYVRALITSGVKVNEIQWWDKGALHFAAKAGFLGTIKILLAAGADPNLRDLHGETPLFYAFKAGASVDPVPVVAALLKGGADLDAANRKGQRIVDKPRAREILARLRDERRRHAKASVRTREAR